MNNTNVFNVIHIVRKRCSILVAFNLPARSVILDFIFFRAKKLYLILILDSKYQNPHILPVIDVIHKLSLQYICVSSAIMQKCVDNVLLAFTQKESSFHTLSKRLR